MIVFPTETFYGLGADALDPAAVERVVALKGRRERNPIALIIADLEMLSAVVAEVPARARRLMDRFWPGPLTLVLPAKRGLPSPLVNDEGGVGVRVSSHPVAGRLASELGRPLTATSANPSGEPPAVTLEQARGYFAGGVGAFIDGGRLTGTRGSTVVKFLPGGWEIVRVGEIAAGELARVLA